MSFGIARAAATAALSVSMIGCSPTQTYMERYMPGQPLDAVKMSAPSFSDKDYCYKIGDRTSGACGFCVSIEGQWVYMQVSPGESWVTGPQDEVK